MASIGRICNQQQSTFSNKDIPIHSKLWKGVENRGRYKEKRKSRKGNGVCGKNEEDARGSRSSIEKSTGGYEETSGQGKKGE